MAPNESTLLENDVSDAQEEEVLFGEGAETTEEPEAAGGGGDAADDPVSEALS